MWQKGVSAFSLGRRTSPVFLGFSLSFYGIGVMICMSLYESRREEREEGKGRKRGWLGQRTVA